MPRDHRPAALAAPVRRRLVAAAAKARLAAYAPYSRFKVGAALLAGDGRIFAGCNVENAASANGICAEQAALARAVAEGARSFDALAVVTGPRHPAAPCGRCRQVLLEFGGRLRVIMTTTGGSREEATLADLLPHPFRR